MPTSVVDPRVRKLRRVHKLIATMDLRISELPASNDIRLIMEALVLLLTEQWGRDKQC